MMTMSPRSGRATPGSLPKIVLGPKPRGVAMTLSPVRMVGDMAEDSIAYDETKSPETNS